MGKDYDDYKQCAFCGHMELECEMHTYQLDKRGLTFEVCEICEAERFPVRERRTA